MTTDHRHPDAETLLSLLIDNVTDYAIFLLDPEGNVASWNAGAARIKGYTAAEILGRHFSSFYTPEDRAAGVPGAVLHLARVTGRYAGEGWRVRQDGSRFWASVVITALTDERGVFRGFGKVTRDMTARREAEQVELRLMAEQTARLAAEATNHAKNAFLASLAHQLQTPLTPLTVGTQSLQRLLAQQKPIPAGLGDTLVTQTARLTTLVQLLVDLSYLDLQRLELHAQPVELTALVAAVLARVQPLTTQHQLRFVPAPAVVVEADPERLGLVLVALLTNAIKYTPRGGDISVQVDAEEETVLLSVQDPGIGIAPADQERIFQRYERAGAGELQDADGLGLGLYVSRELIARHGGQLWCTSSLGQGATFFLRLPRRRLQR
jgi:PAS domain S-box-containing protein